MQLIGNTFQENFAEKVGGAVVVDYVKALPNSVGLIEKIVYEINSMNSMVQQKIV